MPQITRKFEFDSAHRVLHHESKCKHLHGHRYVAEVTVTSPSLDPLGRVVDFSVLKAKIGGWLDENWDHNILLNADDPMARIWTTPAYPALNGDIFSGKPPFLFRAPSSIMGEPLVLGGKGINPTAENIACILYLVVWTFFGCGDFKHIVPEQVKIYETPNCWAVYPHYSRE